MWKRRRKQRTVIETANSWSSATKTVLRTPTPSVLYRVDHIGSIVTYPNHVTTLIRQPSRIQGKVAASSRFQQFTTECSKCIGSLQAWSVHDGTVNHRRNLIRKLAPSLFAVSVGSPKDFHFCSYWTKNISNVLDSDIGKLTSGVASRCYADIVTV